MVDEIDVVVVLALAVAPCQMMRADQVLLAGGGDRIEAEFQAVRGNVIGDGEAEDRVLGLFDRNLPAALADHGCKLELRNGLAEMLFHDDRLVVAGQAGRGLQEEIRHARITVGGFADAHIVEGDAKHLGGARLRRQPVEGGFIERLGSALFERRAHLVEPALLDQIEHRARRFAKAGALVERGEQHGLAVLLGDQRRASLMIDRA